MSPLESRLYEDYRTTTQQAHAEKRRVSITELHHAVSVFDPDCKREFIEDIQRIESEIWNEYLE